MNNALSPRSLIISFPTLFCKPYQPSKDTITPRCGLCFFDEHSSQSVLDVFNSSQLVDDVNKSHSILYITDCRLRTSHEIVMFMRIHFEGLLIC